MVTADGYLDDGAYANVYSDADSYVRAEAWNSSNAYAYSYAIAEYGYDTDRSQARSSASASAYNNSDVEAESLAYADYW